MSGLPAGWARAPIGALCELVNGRAFKPTEWSTTGLPIVRIQNLNSGSAAFNYYAGDYSPRHYLQGGELLFAWSGTPGTSFGAHVWREVPALLNQHIFRVDFDSKILDKRFFRHAINQRLEDLIGSAQGGVGLRHVTKGVFEATEIAIAPRCEQQRIADKLDALLARVDACRDRLDRVPAILKRFRLAVLRSGTTGAMTSDWRSEKALSAPVILALGDVIKVSSGKFLPAKDMVRTGKVPVYGGNGVTGYHDEGNVSEPTLVVGRVGFYCGCVHMTPRCAWVTDNALVVRHDQAVTDLRFLHLALQAIDLRANDSSTAQPVISGQKIYPLPISVPALAEQAEIVRRVESLFALADAIEAKWQAARAQVERLTPALLAKAFRGQLVPQDPNDEPAAELLRRLAQSRADAPAKARKPRQRQPA